jgi:hypothetical protein
MPRLQNRTVVTDIPNALIRTRKFYVSFNGIRHVQEKRVLVLDLKQRGHSKNIAVGKRPISKYRAYTKEWCGIKSE